MLAHGREHDVVARILAGETLGTVFLAKPRMKNRLRWILNSLPQGELTVDEGALEALYHRKSLLPRGVTGVEGDFEKGAVVSVNGKIKLVSKVLVGRTAPAGRQGQPRSGSDSGAKGRHRPAGRYRIS